MRIILIILFFILSKPLFAQTSDLVISGTFKIEKGHIGHNTIYIIDTNISDTIQVLSYENNNLMRKGSYSIKLSMNKNYSIFFVSDGCNNMWYPLKVTVSTKLPKNVKSFPGQSLVYNTFLNLGVNKDDYIDYNKHDNIFEVKK